MAVELVPSEQEKFDSLIRTLEQFKIQLDWIDYTHSQETYMKVVKELSDYICWIKDQELCEIVRHSKYYQKFPLLSNSLTKQSADRRTVLWKTKWFFWST